MNEQMNCAFTDRMYADIVTVETKSRWYYTVNHTLGKLFYSDLLRDCKFMLDLRANSVIPGKLQISRAKSVIHSECKYEKELTINN